MARRRRGYFITFEGIEGSGKTTQMHRLAQHFAGRGPKMLTTREPGGTPAGEAIRRLLLNTKVNGIRATAELYLYLAARVQHLEEVVLPALAEGQVVLCDRFSDATIAYQGYGRGLDLGLVKRLVATAARGLRPDLTLLLDLEPRAALVRVARRRDKNRLDREAIDFHERVQRGYLALARANPSRIKVIAADGPSLLVGDKIRRLVREVIDGLE